MTLRRGHRGRPTNRGSDTRLSLLVVRLRRKECASYAFDYAVATERAHSLLRETRDARHATRASLLLSLSAGAKCALAGFFEISVEEASVGSGIAVPVKVEDIPFPARRIIRPFEPEVEVPILQT